MLNISYQKEYYKMHKRRYDSQQYVPDTKHDECRMTLDHGEKNIAV